MFGDFPAKNTVYTPYIYMVLASPIHKRKLAEHTHTHFLCLYPGGRRQGLIPESPAVTNSALTLALSKAKLMKSLVARWPL